MGQVDRLSRIEKAFYPSNDKVNGTISRLLPKLRRDEVDEKLDLLKISSVVDGTKVEGFGRIHEHSYKWKLAIESVVQSIAQVPDRFFDIKGRSYSIDINRKVSVHSLPTYENYKDAIIYKINSHSKGAPPLAKIIFDKAMEDKGSLEWMLVSAVEQITPTMTFAQLWKAAGNFIHADGTLEKVSSGVHTYYYPLDKLDRIVNYATISNNLYNYSVRTRLYHILDEDIISAIDPELIDPNSLSNTKVNYNANHAMTDLCDQINLDQFGSVEEVVAQKDICEGDYLAIIVDNNNDYHALIGVYAERTHNEPTDLVVWYKPSIPVNVSQFKGLDMWLRFSSINELIYFLITKYKDDIIEISPATINANEGNDTWSVDTKTTTVESDTDSEAVRRRGKLWAYLNPKTLKPYDDDYWFHQGEPFLVSSLTLAEHGKPLKAKKIVVSANQWPGMYMFIGETWIRDKETGKDEHMQIKAPLCKVKSDHTLILQADGEPTVFNLQLEVAKPTMGNMLEITTYEAATRMEEGENGSFYAIDGSTQVLSE